MTSYKTVVKETTRTSFTEKKSEFITTVRRIETEEDVKVFLDGVRKEYPDATHHCYAYILKGTETARFSDDGEPSGTAGMPILEVLKREGVSGLCVVVTRYFGGILLGAGGLVRAYARAAKLGLDEAGTASFVPYVTFCAVLPYSGYEKVAKEAAKYGVTVDDTVFAADVTLSFRAKNEDYEKFAAFIADYTGGKVACSVTGETMGPA